VYKERNVTSLDSTEPKAQPLNKKCPSPQPRNQLQIRADLLLAVPSTWACWLLQNEPPLALLHSLAPLAVGHTLLSPSLSVDGKMRKNLPSTIATITGNAAVPACASAPEARRVKHN
jgi:hypothetical protein